MKSPHSPLVWPAACARSNVTFMDVERRVAPRTPIHIYFNKYIDGMPHLCEAVEISMTGVLLRRVHEPDATRACYALEIAEAGDPGPEPAERVWLCAAPVWRLGQYEALSFVSPSHLDKLKLADLLASSRPVGAA